MKVIIKINGTKFLSPDAVTAAKVADLLGKMRPVDSKFWHQDFSSPNYQSGNAYFFDDGNLHQVLIEQIKNGNAIFENEAQADDFVKTMLDLDATPEIPQPQAETEGGAK